MNGVHAAKHAVVDRENEQSYASKKAIVTKTKYVYNRNYNCTNSVECILLLGKREERDTKSKDIGV